jgi:hypothetical protein
VKEWSLNERVRRKVRKIASIVVSAGLRAAARFGLSQWRQQMDNEQHEEAQLMGYGGWEVKLDEWNGGVMIADFWPSARGLEELQEAAEQREEDHEMKMQEYARAASARNAEDKRRAAVELKAAMVEFEPGGLAGGRNEFGAEFFREVDPGTVSSSHSRRQSKDMDDLTVDGKQREQRSAAAGLREALCLADGSTGAEGGIVRR